MEMVPLKRQEWGQLEARLEGRSPFGASVEMDPEMAQVREPLHLSWVIVPEESELLAGTDLLTLVPRTWKLDLNGAFPELSKFYAVWAGGYGNGRQCLVKADAPVEGLEATCELIPAGFEFLIHVHLEGGPQDSSGAPRWHSGSGTADRAVPPLRDGNSSGGDPGVPADLDHAGCDDLRRPHPIPSGDRAGHR